MTKITTDQINEFADLCRADPIYLDNFKRGLINSGLWEMMGAPEIVAKKDGPPPMAPARSAITAVQTALFDNWPSGVYVKNNPNRYGFSIELWDLPADKIEAVKVKHMNYAFKANISLMGKKALLSQINVLRKPRKNADSTVCPVYLDSLTQIASGMSKHDHIGLLNTTIRNDGAEYERGVYYHPFQFVIAVIEDGKVLNASLILDQADISNPLTLAPFDDQDWQGGPLGRLVKAQSRLDLCGFAPGWASN
jgi:hypothetical protein